MPSSRYKSRTLTVKRQKDDAGVRLKGQGVSQSFSALNQQGSTTTPSIGLGIDTFEQLPVLPGRRNRSTTATATAQARCSAVRFPPPAEIDRRGVFRRLHFGKKKANRHGRLITVSDQCRGVSG